MFFPAFHLAAVAESCKDGVDLGFRSLNWLQLFVLGVVQGITELFPISSTAHLRIVPGLLGWPDPGSIFSAIVQMAGLAAIVAYFWRDINKLVRESVSALIEGNSKSFSLRLTMGIIVGTLPIIVAGLLLKKTLNSCNSPLRSLLVIGIASVVMSALLALAEWKGIRQRYFQKLTLLDGLLVGIGQAFALIPGVSRSGSTLTTGLFLGMERETAARFSFLLGIPAIILAGTSQLHELLKAGLTGSDWLMLGFALLVSTISAFCAVFFLLRYLEKYSTWPFVVYRFLMGVFLIYFSLNGRVS